MFTSTTAWLETLAEQRVVVGRVVGSAWLTRVQQKASVRNVGPMPTDIRVAPAALVVEVGNTV